MPPERVTAVDIDLRRIHAWFSPGPGEEGHKVCYKESDPIQAIKAVAEDRPNVVLIEVASPHQYGDKLYKKKVAWVIYNSTIATMFHFCGVFPYLLVAPSNVWTKRLEEKVRQGLAGANARNHDLRECQTMIHMYRTEPNRWVGFGRWLKEL